MALAQCPAARFDGGWLPVAIVAAGVAMH